MNLLASAAFLNFGALLVLFGANASDIIRSLSLDYADFGLVASMLSLGVGCGIGCAGPTVHRLPTRALFVASVGGVGLAALSLGPTTSYLTLLVTSFAIGFGAGFYETLLNTVIVEQSGISATRRLLFIHSSATLGAALTPFAIGFLRESLSLTWFNSFHAAGLLHLVLLLGLPGLPSIARTHRNRAPSATEAMPASQGGSLLAAICVATFVYVGVESALTFFVAEHAENGLGLSASRASGVIGFFWLGLLIGRLTLGLVPRPPNAGSTALLASVSASIAGAFFLGAALVPEVAMTLIGFFLGGVFPIMIGLAGIASLGSSHEPSVESTRGSATGSTGMAVAVAAGLGSLGGFIIPWLTGILATHTDLPTALSTLSAWLFLLVGACAVVHRRHTR